MAAAAQKMSVAELMASAFYFHGYLPRNQVERLLEKEGDWLVFEESKEDIPITVVAVKKAQSEKHRIGFFRIRLGINGKMYAESDNGFDCLESLVGHYASTKTPLVKGSKALLTRPIPLEPWHIFPHEIITDADKRDLGNGCFGQVLKLKLKRDGESKVEEVAVKECQARTPKDREAIYREGRMTMRSQCPYVVTMFGISTLTPPIRMVLEFLPLGDLATYLKLSTAKATSEKKKYVTTWQLTKFATDTAAALVHVASLQLVHLDIATRNCLIKAEPGTPNVLRAVLSDFGLSRDGPSYTIQEDDPISQRWAAPESLKPPAVATTKSDVWSFGVLLWEIFSHASVPYPELENTTGLLVRLETGHRMSPPKALPEALHKLMSDAWAIDPASRPTFTQVHATIAKVLESLPKDK